MNGTQWLDTTHWRSETAGLPAATSVGRDIRGEAGPGQGEAVVWSSSSLALGLPCARRCHRAVNEKVGGRGCVQRGEEEGGFRRNSTVKQLVCAVLENLL